LTDLLLTGAGIIHQEKEQPRRLFSYSAKPEITCRVALPAA
jgi:hypothetical protein